MSILYIASYSEVTLLLFVLAEEAAADVEGAGGGGEGSGGQARRC